MATKTKQIIIPIDSDLGKRIIATPNFKSTYPTNRRVWSDQAGRYVEEKTNLTQAGFNSYVKGILTLTPALKFTCSMKEVGNVNYDFARLHLKLFVEMVRFAAKQASYNYPPKGVVIYNSNTNLNCARVPHIKKIHTYKGAYNSTVYIYAIDVNP